ncbi:DUF3987 domain-containing protein [Nitrosomonas sp. ANs5]|uniref:DUF3987 domain-containing protein n=1 Tax=Nitrosomonas sp. ANs5 TaxID=3423941 RepID=UPI003D339C93
MRDEVQVPIETAGQSVLAAVSLLAQALYDVETISGVKPISLYALTLAGSGESKSTTDGIAMECVNSMEKSEYKPYAKKLDEWNRLGKKAKENEPPPIAPFRTVKSATVQGMVRSFSEGVPDQGNFTDEGATMLTGWGMSAEQMRESLATFNGLWDGTSISVMRGGVGRTHLDGKRFCLHWMTQPTVVAQALNNPIFQTIGFFPRVLLAHPEPMKPRLYREFYPGENTDVALYWSRCNVFLKERYSIPEGDRQVIRLSADARKPLAAFWEEMELSRDKDNEYNDLKPFCTRGAEQVCRIAGVLAAYENHTNGKTNFTLSAKNINDAIRLFMYSLNSWRDLFGKREDTEAENEANDLHKWLTSRLDATASEKDMLQNVTPKYLRSAAKRDRAIAVLRNQGRIKKATESINGMTPRIANNEWTAI